MLKQDGKSGTVIREDLRKLSEKARGIINRAIIRWRMYRDGNEWLKPYVFERLKLYTKGRSNYRKKLWALNEKMERKDTKSSMKRVMKIWYSKIDSKRRTFYGMQYMSLTNLALKQARHLNSCADDIDGLNDSV